MAVAYSEIARALAGARRRRGWIAAAAFLGYGASAALLFLLLGAAALSLGAGPWVRPIALSLAVCAVGAAAGWTVLSVLRSGLGEPGAARALAAEDESLRSDLLSAVELERDRGEVQRTGRFSVALLDAHAVRTAERARGVDLRRAIPARPARRAGLALGGVSLLHLVALVAGGATLAGAYGRVLAGEPARAGPPRAEPITGDVQITYRYPAYMGRPEKKLSGTGGEVAAPSGTEVRLETRSDRPVVEAQILLETGARTAPAARAGGEPDPAGQAAPAREGPQVLALSVANGRDLSGGFVVKDSGSYRFRFTRGSKVLALGPPIPVAAEPDAFPEVRITAPAQEVEVDARDRVRVDWIASDDVGLQDLTLVLKVPAAEEKRRVVRSFDATRRESGSLEVDLAPLRLAEGEKLLYWLEVRDGDAVSGPKRAASTTHAVKIYSEAEHRRAALQKAQALWEEMVRLLGDRLERLPRGEKSNLESLSVGESFDLRGRTLADRLRAAAAELRRDRSAPAELAAALANVSGGVRAVAERTATARLNLGRLLRMGRADDLRLQRWVDDLDAEMDAELEKDVLYLEKLFDQRKAEDLVRMARDLAQRRRDLASLLEKYRQAPSDQARKELLAEVARLKARMQEMLARMAELAKGIDDEHMNAEALAEMSRSKDLMGGLDRVAEMLQKGDLEAALRELDAMGSLMQEMLASLERTAGQPGKQNAALAKEMMELKRQLEAVQAEQEQLAAETERVKAEYRRRIAERIQAAEDRARHMAELAREARERVREAGKGVGMRSEEAFGTSRDRLQDLEKALAMRDFDAALESVRRALPPMQRLAIELEEDALTAERYPMGREPERAREAAQKAEAALPPARQVRQELERLFPDPRAVLGPGEQARLDRQSRRQAELERQAGAMQQRLQQLMKEAPIFPPQAPQLVGESRGHMQQAAEELGRKNPQRGHSQQRQALDALSRFRKGLEEMARRGGRGGGGFPFPFAAVDLGGGGEEGSMGDPSREKVEIPGAEAHRAPEEFRRDLLEAMKQGAPEAYQAEVKRYYEELVR
ncbi:MAG TPA: DUF4175 family protein [Anaeromyxobacteraceae bacterium]|nr:DUF4175 family protein [Anaeromyxobacteraceae bacterium]